MLNRIVRLKRKMRKIIFDSETTGMNQKPMDPFKDHKIIEIAFVEMIGRKLTGNHLHFYLNPGRFIEPKAIEIHGITDEFVKDKPKFIEVQDDIKDFISGAELVAHNANFDVTHLDNELARTGANWRTRDICTVMCTLKAAWAMDGVQYVKGYNLDALSQKYNVNIPREHHGALLDAQILAQVYLSLTKAWYL